MPTQYPFCAVVGSDDMTLALTLVAIDPLIGGVLVRGEKGTAKTTTVRGLADVLPPVRAYRGDRFSIDPADPSAVSPDGPFDAGTPVDERPVRLVELPVGASDDRVTGSLKLDSALRDGVVEFEPGLLARAHRGLLYVDEVNLLHDHLVDLLLDAAATGRVSVERDGVSVEHASRFVLIGTMNPEEGELRPQLLDRFGLTVEVSAPREPELRVEVVRRRLAFDADPAAFAAAWADEQDALRARLESAQELMGDVFLDDDALITIAEICAAFDVDGLRADLVTARTAAAHAAWQGRTHITREDVRVAARLALPHRRRRNPFDEPGLDEDRLDDLLGDDEPDPGPDDDGPGGPDGSGSDSPQDGPEDQRPADAPDASPNQDEQQPQPAGAGSVAAAGDPTRARLLVVRGTGEGQSGRRSRARTPQGRVVGQRPDAASGRLHLPGTIAAAAPHQRSRGGLVDGRGLALSPSDLRRAETVGQESNLVLLCVDASGSMAARRRMEQVKTAVLSLLLDAYRRRDKVALVTFRQHTAEVVLPPTGSVDVASRRLAELPAGGRTPLAEGLERSAEILRREALRDPSRRPLLVVVTDGRATSGADALGRAHRSAAHLAATGLDSVVVDCETGRFRLGLAAQLAGHLRAEHVPLGEVTADGLTDVVHAATSSREGAA
ncbi:VWA domain-containing protein [Aeromicrobium sp. Marseille-Q0843]|uniref:Mg-protoporphyrin IX chelatase n=1 Tax=Aeromicrobium phoceense TaxID=2754045 RepID=A0A838XEF7_9ACTN|nr:VWA domain-containing protein [Aeromicrobium phoceense]MBA4608935.1 VWA domain-containing protein [Aeromicrobium phoceense]